MRLIDLELAVSDATVPTVDALSFVFCWELELVDVLVRNNVDVPERYLRLRYIFWADASLNNQHKMSAS